jgi:hypothetical protein
MPRKPRPPCSVPGCPELTTSGRCIKHAKEAEQQRGTTTAKGCGVKWERIRKALLVRASVVRVVQQDRDGCRPLPPSLAALSSLGVWVIRTRGLVSVRCVRRATTRRPRSTSRAVGLPSASSLAGVVADQAGTPSPSRKRTAGRQKKLAPQLPPFARGRFIKRWHMKNPYSSTWGSRDFLAVALTKFYFLSGGHVMLFG